MLYYFYAPSGTGKSALKTAMLEPFLRNDYEAVTDEKGLLDFLKMSPCDRLKKCHQETDYLNQTEGLNLEKPLHTVQSNETIYTKVRGKKIKNYHMPGDKLGLYDECYETWCPPPGSIIADDEAQQEFGGRESAGMSPRVSAELQLHRKWGGLDILFFSQRGNILDLNIRDNCVIIEVSSMHHKFDKYGFIISTTWNLKVFKNLSAYENYRKSEKKTYKSTSFTFEGNVFEHFDSEEGKEHFIYLAKKRGINLRIKPDATSVDEYVETNPYTPPDDYRKMTKAEKKKKKEANGETVSDPNRAVA